MNSESGTPRISPWTGIKYALALLGLALVLAAPRYDLPWLGYIGLGLIAVAFLLRFKYRVPRRGE